MFEHMQRSRHGYVVLVQFCVRETTLEDLRVLPASGVGVFMVSCRWNIQVEVLEHLVGLSGKRTDRCVGRHFDCRACERTQDLPITL